MCINKCKNTKTIEKEMLHFAVKVSEINFSKNEKLRLKIDIFLLNMKLVSTAGLRFLTQTITKCLNFYHLY